MAVVEAEVAVHERIRVVMSNHPIDRSKERLVKISLEIPTFGTPEQAEQTARNAVQSLAVSFSTTLTGSYKKHRYTFNAKGNPVPEEDIHE